jgi:hypothetical protein
VLSFKETLDGDFKGEYTVIFSYTVLRNPVFFNVILWRNVQKFAKVISRLGFEVHCWLRSSALDVHTASIFRAK